MSFIPWKGAPGRSVFGPSRDPVSTTHRNVGNQHFHNPGISQERPLSFDEMCGLIRQDPLAGALAAQRQHEGFRHRDYELTATAAALARELQMQEDLQDRFYELDFFQGGYTPNRSRLLLHCTQFIFRDRKGSDSHRAGERARAMQAAFDAGKSADEILQMLVDQRGYGSGDPPDTVHGKPTWQAAIPLGSEPAPVRRAAPTETAIPHLPIGSRREQKKTTRNEVPDKPACSLQPKKLSISEILKRFLLVDVGPLHPDHAVFKMQVNERRHMVLCRLPDEAGHAMYKAEFDASFGMRGFNRKDRI